MNKVLLAGAALLLTWLPSQVLANTKTTVKQVTSAVTLSTDEDYHITSATPFTATGSINITDIDHAVVILDSLKPSLAEKQLGFITIKGEPAKYLSNCDIRIYDRGAIILPYTSTTFTSPLTTYTNKDFTGDSCRAYDLGNSGGFMQTLTAAQLNNKFRSFRLKRGYMVTFALKSAGYGYSRCFIADDADLAVTLPNVMSGRVSSYRIFKWQNTSKAGLANDNNATHNEMLNTQWCYDFSFGADLGMDRECVPHHIYEDWPSAATMGTCTWSPHMKTNNEPGNSADDHPQSVATVLANWQNLMRTGMRLCSPSSHDGSLNWLAEFIDSIDARGWRCDIIDAHCYWTSGQFYNLASWYTKYKQRPIWISEWVWGASWNKNGAFADGVTEASNAEAVEGILKNLNSWGYIERYSYWNSERDPSRLLKNNTLTELGRYYRDMDPGIGYNKDYNKYVPTLPSTTSIRDLAIGAFTARTSTVKLTWSDSNGDLLDSMALERQLNDGEWQVVYRAPISDNDATSYTFTDTLTETGTYNYRVHVYPYNHSTQEAVIYSNEVQTILNGATGNASLQWGNYTSANADVSYNYFAVPFEEDPAIVFGAPSYDNYNVGVVSMVNNSITVNKKRVLFRAQYVPCTVAGTASTSFTSTAFDGTADTYTPYLIAPDTTGVVAGLQIEAGKMSSNTTRADDSISYTFTKPFSVKPVVLATMVQNNPDYPLLARVHNVTTTGFTVTVQRQNQLITNGSVRKSGSVNFVAIQPGKGFINDSTYIIVADTDLTFKSNVRQNVYYGDTLDNVKFLIQPQTMNRKDMYLVRTKNLQPGTHNSWIRLQIDPSADNTALNLQNQVAETFGYVVIGNNPRKATALGINTINASTTRAADGIYTLGGVRLNSSLANLPRGCYIVVKNGKTAKVVK